MRSAETAVGPSDQQSWSRIPVDLGHVSQSGYLHRDGMQRLELLVESPSLPPMATPSGSPADRNVSHRCSSSPGRHRTIGQPAARRHPMKCFRLTRSVRGPDQRPPERGRSLPLQSLMTPKGDAGDSGPMASTSPLWRVSRRQRHAEGPPRPAPVSTCRGTAHDHGRQ